MYVCVFVFVLVYVLNLLFCLVAQNYRNLYGCFTCSYRNCCYCCCCNCCHCCWCWCWCYCLSIHLQKLNICDNDSNVLRLFFFSMFLLLFIFFLFLDFLFYSQKSGKIFCIKSLRQKIKTNRQNKKKKNVLH